MLDVLWTALGLVAGVVALGAVYYFATAPRRVGKRKSWVAPPSGRTDELPPTF